MERASWERFRPDRNVGSHVVVFREVASTMDTAWQFADAGAPHGTVVRAYAQHTGRGRFSRRWVSGQGESLLASAILRCPPVPASAPLSIAASLAVLDCVRSFGAGSATIKWPNDVLLDGKKVAGALVETRAFTDGRATAVVGIGINVNLDVARHAEIADTATSLASCRGVPIDVDDVEDRLLLALDGWTARLSSDVAGVVAAWKASLSSIGSTVTVRTRTGVVVGKAEDVDEHGRLLVRDGRGHIRALAEGDVTLRA